MDAFPQGATVAGVHQMIGNVWEWTATPFGHWDHPKTALQLPCPMKTLRGGAFDSYFDGQVTCHFSSGDSPLARKHNIGFRCALSLCDVVPEVLQVGEEEGDA